MKQSLTRSQYCALLIWAFFLFSCQNGPDQQSLLRERAAHSVPNHLELGGQEIYAIGANIAWFNFARDFGHGLDEPRLRASLGELQAAGANSVRWWLHTDGAFSPEWGSVDGARMVTGPGEQVIDDLQMALDIAAEYEIYIVFSLWSFDMLNDNAYRKPPTRDNYRLLTEDVILQSYIDNALIPMVQKLNAHPHLLAWELFNEPENMTEPWFLQQKAFYGGPVPSLQRLQRVQALMAAAIHRSARELGQRALVTTGSKSMAKYNSDALDGINLYRDDRMIAAADGDADASLDFYAPHYYNNEGMDGWWSPFHRHVSHWEVDKPVVIGEFHVEELQSRYMQNLQASELCQRLKQNGYAGSWAWQWVQHEDSIKKCIRSVAGSDTSDSK